jgi:hypothetical protein
MLRQLDKGAKPLPSWLGPETIVLPKFYRRGAVVIEGSRELG